MSRSPPLGYEYFTRLAYDTAKAGLAPLDLKYHFDVVTMSGEQKHMPFLLRGRMAETFLKTYIDAWVHLHGNTPRPVSELVDVFEQFGRLGNEDIMTEKMVHQWTASKVFTGDNLLRKDVFPAKKKKLTFHEWLRKRDDEYREERRKARAKERFYGKEQRIKRKLGERLAREQAVRTAVGRAEISRQRFDSLSPAWRKFLIYNSGDSKSLIEWARQQYALYGNEQVVERNDGFGLLLSRGV